MVLRVLMSRIWRNSEMLKTFRQMKETPRRIDRFDEAEVSCCANSEESGTW